MKTKEELEFILTKEMAEYLIQFNILKKELVTQTKKNNIEELEKINKKLNKLRNKFIKEFKNNNKDNIEEYLKIKDQN